MGIKTLEPFPVRLKDQEVWGDSKMKMREAKTSKLKDFGRENGGFLLSTTYSLKA